MSYVFPVESCNVETVALLIRKTPDAYLKLKVYTPVLL